MKTRRLFALFCASVMLFSFAACSSNTDSADSGTKEQQTENNSSAITTSDDKPIQSDEKLIAFSKNASLAETIMVDEGGVKITAIGLDYTNRSVELKLLIENNSGKDLSFVSGSLGYSCNSINGYMVEDGYLNCDVKNGKKANDTISFNYDSLMLYGINEIADIEIGFSMSDDDYNYTYSGPRQVRTSAFGTHDYSKDYYQETTASRSAMNTYDYDMTYFSQDTLYDVNGVKLLSSGVMINQDGETTLLLELENTTGNMVSISTSDIAINGLIVDSSTWSTDTINPGKRGIIAVELSSVVDAEYWGDYGIEEVGSVALSLRQRNSDGEDITDKATIKIVVPDVKAEFDATGTEFYNNNGLRIVGKRLLEDPSEYSSDVHVLLFAENTSGKTLTISDVYDSVSVNGFMTNYFSFNESIADGQCVAIIIDLMGYSLENNNISDIKEIEVGFEIKAGGNTIDKFVITTSVG